MTCTLTTSPLMALIACAPGIGRGLDRGDIADDHRRDERVADLRHGAGEFDVRSFEHRVRAFDEGDEAAGFDDSDCLMSHNFCWFVLSVEKFTGMHLSGVSLIWIRAMPFYYSPKIVLLRAPPQFFVRRESPKFSRANSAALIIAFLRLSGFVLRRVEHDAELIQVRADRCANSRPVFADAGGEHHRVRAVQLQESSCRSNAARWRTKTSSASCAVALPLRRLRSATSRMSLIRRSKPLSPDSLQSCRSRFVKGDAERSHHVRHGFGIEIADAIVLRQTGLRAHAHAGADRHAVQNSGD